MSTHWYRLVTLAFVCGVGLEAAVAAQTSIKLNAPLPRRQTGVVNEFRVLPDGSGIVYTANQRHAQVLELFRAAIDGSGAVRLHPRLELDLDVEDFAVAPDLSRVVYRLVRETDTDYVAELYAAPLDGSGAPVRLNAPLVSGGFVHPQYQVSPDSTTVLYVASQDTAGVFELYSVPIDGSQAPVKLNGPIAGAGINSGGDILPTVVTDGVHVVYRADQSAAGVYEVFSVPIHGGAAPVRLHPAPIAGGQVEVGFRFQAGAGRVVFRGDLEVNERFELYAAPLDGSAPAVKLNGPLIANGDVQPFGGPFVEISPDGNRVVYLADALANERFDLFMVPIDGSQAPVRLNGTLGSSVSTLRISPLGDLVVYRRSSDGMLFRTAIGGGTPPATLGVAADFEFLFSADGNRIVYEAGPDSLSEALFSVPITGGPAVQLSAQVSYPERLDWHSVGATGHVVFVVGSSFTQRTLWSAPIDGSTPSIALNAPLFGTETGDFELVPDGSQVVYAAQQESDALDAYVVPVDRSSQPVRLNAPLRPFEVFDDVTAFDVVPDGSQAVYATGGNLFSALLDPPYTVVQLTDSPQGVVTDLRVSPDSSQVVYTVSDGSFPLPHLDLYSAPVDGSSPAIQLNPASWRVAPPYEFTLDGSRVVFVVKSSSIHHVFVRPIDGSTPALFLDQTFSTTAEFRLTQDGASVVYRGHQLSWSDPRRLYRVSLDGGVPVTLVDDDVSGFRLAGPDRVAFWVDFDTLYGIALDAPGIPVPLVDAVAFDLDIEGETLRCSPDGHWTVFRASDGAFPPTWRVFSARTDEAFSAVLLGTPFLPEGDVSAFALSSDGARVLFNGDRLTDGTSELFSVPIAGGPSIRLNSELGVNNDVVDVFASTEQGLVVYVADEDTNNAWDVYSAPIDGSQASVRLSAGTLGGAVEDFLVTPDGATVVYRADHQTDDALELFRVAIDGSRRIRKLNTKLVEGGDVHDYVLTSDGSRVLYLADQDVDEAMELYMSLLDPDPARLGPSASPSVAADREF